jgi:hypothetical protein
LVGVFAEGRAEVCLAERDAGQGQRVEAIGPAVIEAGGADELERPGCPAAFGKDRSLEAGTVMENVDFSTEVL